MLNITGRAYGKVNLALDVLGRRTDGYHDLRMVMQTVGLYDEITLRENKRGRHSINKSEFLPSDRRNLALAAAELFCDKTDRPGFFIDISLKKNIPVSAGMGGGSADAAAVLRMLWETLEPGLTEETVLAWALELGSDVPFCLLGGTCRAEGRGERLTPLPPLPDCTVLLCKPPAGVSTRMAFSLADQIRIKARPDIPGLEDALARQDLRRAARYMANVFEEPVAVLNRDIAPIRASMIQHGALGAVMTGTGSTVFGLFENAEAAKPACEALRTEYAGVWITENKGRLLTKG